MTNSERNAAKRELAQHRAELAEVREGLARIRRTYEELEWVTQQFKSA